MKTGKTIVATGLRMVGYTATAVVATLPIIPAIFKASRKRAPALLRTARKSLKKK